MYPDHDVLEEQETSEGTFRVILTPDEYAEEPYGDCQNPIMRIERGWHATHVAGEQYTDTDCVEAAINRWGTPSGGEWWGSPSGGDWRKVVMYLKAFFGATDVAAWYSGDYCWYVSYDTTTFREVTGATGPDMTEWKAYVEGDVYGYAIQKRVTWESEGWSDRETWEDVPDDYPCSGYYGRRHAEESAREAFREYVKDKDTYEPKAGDVVVFPAASLPSSRERHYTVTNVQDNVIAFHVAELGEWCDYTITTEQAREMGMRKA